MQPGCRARRRTAPRPAVGPPPARARPARCSNFTWPRGCGVRPAPAIPRGSRAARSRAGKGPGPDNPAAAARTHQSAVPPPEPGLHSELHGPTAPGLSGAPVPHYTARSGANDAASGPATAAATPPPGGGPGRIWRGAQPRLSQPRPADQSLHQDWRAPRPMGKRQRRGASAPRGGGLR